MTIETQGETQALASDLSTSPLRIKPYYESRVIFAFFYLFLPYFFSIYIDNRVSNAKQTLETNSRLAVKKWQDFIGNLNRKRYDVNFIVYFTVRSLTCSQ